MSKKNTSIAIPTPWRIKRYYLYAVVTVIALALPWITIEGNHFFLLSFDKMKLHLAFVQYDMQELYLMPFLLMLMFIGIFGITVMGGRVFCGWVCPQTVFRVIYRDLIETKLLGLRKRIKNKQQEPDMSKFENKIKKVVAVLLWTILALVAASNFMWFFVPPEDFMGYIANPMEHLTLIGFIAGIAAFLIYDVIILQENFCIYVCPYSRIQSVLYDEHTIMALYNPHRGGHIYDENKEKQFTKQKALQEVEPHAECTACESCVTVCPTHIDIRKGLQLECINCLECVDACTTVMGKLGKESLITWSSDYEIIDQKGKTQYFRPKILSYIGILAVITVILVMMGNTKEHMLLNINKETRLYGISKTFEGDMIVKNEYTFLLQNTENEEHEYYFEVIAPEGMENKITIERPVKAFSVKPGKKEKDILVLQTNEMLVDDDRKDTTIPIQIRAYAVGYEEGAAKEIVVYRDSVFIFPRADIYRKKANQ